MKFSFSVQTVQAVDADAVVVFVPAFDRIADSTLKAIDSATNGAVAKLLATEEFAGKQGQMATLYRPSEFKTGRLILAGLGDAKTLDADSFRKAMGVAGRYAPLIKCARAAMSFDGFERAEYVQAAVEGYLLGSYKMLAYKTGEDAMNPVRLGELVCIAKRKPVLARMEKAAQRGEITAEGQILVRQLAYTPANDLTPSMLADRARELARKHKYSCRVLDQAAIEKENMGAFLSVARGSEEPPRFIILRYDGGPKGQKPIVLVGKGITFDSGGISLKPGLNMHEMKQDMTGSAVVIATIDTAARLNVPRNIVALVPTCENLPSGRATRPGDVITSRKGKTIEVINTDAEGRLILADALDYANKFDPQAVIDVATLTGATLYILGYSGAPILGNNTKLLDRIQDAAGVVGERVWPLPIWDDHREQMKSEIADLANAGGKPAGTITASAFLENFIGDWPWAHIDIASMDLEFKGRPYIPKGASGFGLRLLIELLSTWKKL